jgi:hypothetical protein
VMQRGGWIPARTMKIVAIRPLELTGPEEYARLEPSEALMTSKKVSTGKALIPGMGTLRAVMCTSTGFVDVPKKRRSHTYFKSTT